MAATIEPADVPDRRTRSRGSRARRRLEPAQHAAHPRLAERAARAEDERVRQLADRLGHPWHDGGRARGAAHRPLEDIPAIFAAGVGYRLVRRELGVRAFGVNAFTADAGEQLIEDHDETGSGSGGHEELYVVIAGHARFTIDGIEHDAPAGTLVFVPDPDLAARRARARRRHRRAVVGGRAGQPYAISPWETSFGAKELADAGDPGAAADLMGDALAEYPATRPRSTTPPASSRWPAVARRRSRTSPPRSSSTRRCATWAAEDVDFDPIRDDPAFPNRVGV